MPERSSLEAACCFCDGGGDAENMLVVHLALSTRPQVSQQWWAHPACVRAAMSDSAVWEVRPELASLLQS
jgi:hypothetical protein